MYIQKCDVYGGNFWVDGCTRLSGEKKVNQLIDIMQITCFMFAVTSEIHETNRAKAKRFTLSHGCI